MKKQNYLAPALGLALALTLLCSGCGSLGLVSKLKYATFS